MVMGPTVISFGNLFKRSSLCYVWWLEALLDESKFRYVLDQAKVVPFLDQEHSTMSAIKTDHWIADGAVSRWWAEEVVSPLLKDLGRGDEFKSHAPDATLQFAFIVASTLVEPTQLLQPISKITEPKNACKNPDYLGNTVIRLSSTLSNSLFSDLLDWNRLKAWDTFSGAG